MMKQWVFETEPNRETDPQIAVDYHPLPVASDFRPDVSLAVSDETGDKVIWIHAGEMDHLAAAWLAMRKAERKTDEANPNHVPF